jgi:hypothetical protein
MADVPLVTGKDAKCRFFLGTNELVTLARTWTVRPKVTKIEEHIGGEDRARLQSLIDYFDLEYDCATRDGKIVNAAIGYYATIDQTLPPQAAAAGVRLAIYDGTRVAWVCKELNWDDWELGQVGRNKVMNTKLNMRFRYFDPSPAV